MRRWGSQAGIALAVVVLLAIALVRVSINDPRIHVRWQSGLALPDLTVLEQRYRLADRRPVADGVDTFRYALADSSSDNIRALLADPAVVDTGYIDRQALTTEGRDVEIGWRFRPRDALPGLLSLGRFHRSLWLLLGGVLLLWASRRAAAIRRNTAVGVLCLVFLLTLAVPFAPGFVAMGGSADHESGRGPFEAWFGGRVRFEKHLSQVIVWKTYQQLGETEAAPRQAVDVMTRVAAAGFVASALAVGVVESWSPLALRYLALALLAPAALLYFGWREFGYLSLSMAAYPLLARGIQSGSMRIEAGSAVTGLGAAFHGSGLVGLVSAWLAAIGGGGDWLARVWRALRVTAWGTAAYLGWMALYVVVLKLVILPDSAAAEFSPWRRWLVQEDRLGRIAWPILSANGMRDVLLSGWVAGVPLLIVALSLRRRFPAEVRTALWYVPPSILFLLFRWPFDGIGGGMDLVVAGFPALYALAWVCAHDPKRATVAASLLASAHLVFWWVVTDERFVP